MKNMSVLIGLAITVAVSLTLPSVAEEAPNDSPSSDGVPFAAPGRFAETFDAGLQAYEADRPDRAYRLWLSIAKQGDLAAMRNLGYLLEHGLGIETNASEAAKWYSRAATRGLTSAQVNLAALFYAGNGVPRDNKLAAQWYARAARVGHAHAQYKLAQMIEAGEASAGNLDLAKKLYGWSVDAGHSSALESLRQLDARFAPLSLRAHSDTSRARDEASLEMGGSTSFKALAGAGDTPLADSIRLRKSDASGLSEAREKFVGGERSAAIAIWRKLALKSQADAQYRLALALLQGHGVVEDRAEALYWLDISATGGHTEAEQLLKTLKD
jgi:hypothetical protein